MVSSFDEANQPTNTRQIALGNQVHYDLTLKHNLYIF